MTGPDLRNDIARLFERKKMRAIAAPVIVCGYLVYVFFAFDLMGLAGRARMDNAATLVTDMYSYKTHVTRDNRSGETSVSIEGERKGAYPDGVTPDWVHVDGQTTRIDLGGGQIVTFLPGSALTMSIPDFGTIEASMVGREVVTNLNNDIPDWISLSKTRLAITTDEGRVSFTRNKAEAFNYFTGWELFFFTLDSPYYGHGIVDLVLGERIDPTRSNLGGAAQDFWHNKMWSHSQVVWALFETILMAFLGTFGAAIISLPLAFLAAKNFTPIQTVRFALRRVFDLFRGIDGLIWTIILARAFGPGPLTGALAILLTDTGSFGKMFSEALENVDEKQVEGVASTGAAMPHRYRFGVIPQVTPVLLSQVLFSFESSTRSATIIGAITGGGIGLLLTQAMLTQKDWEEVTYYIILVVLMVMVMDSLSGWLRRKLIKGE
ncbi:phosphonate ABC transporter, permease protein PhnE [Celeribacter marinus]|uniref:phosphonate ABC transporter, permease protein PhnE n=1 Tax=Celeribacter marinus TaxID=1397108 RepID=UPI003F6CF465